MATELAPLTPATQTADNKPVEYKAFQSTELIRLTRAMVRNKLAKATKSGQRPSDNELDHFIMLCRARQLNPWEGDAFLVGYDGKDGAQFSTITAHQALLKRAEAHPQFDGMKSGVIVVDSEGQIIEMEGDFYLPNHKLLGGWATVYRKDRTHPMTKKLRTEARQKNSRFWQDDTSGMIVKCAEADALRSAFPNTLAGMYLREEMDEQPRDPVVVSPPPLGRQNLRVPKQEAMEPPNGNGHAHAADDQAQPPPPENDDNMAAKDTYDMLCENVQLAEDARDMPKIQADIVRAHDLLGDPLYQDLNTRWNNKMQALTPGKKK